MDIVKSKVKKKNYLLNKKNISIAGAGFVLILLFGWTKSSLTSVFVERSDVVVEKVKQGNINATVEGYGKLISGKQQLIAAQTVSKVKEIILRPGAHVTAESVIVKLENPELEIEVENKKYDLSLKKASLMLQEISNKRELLQESASLAEVKVEFETAQMKRKAEEELYSKGIVSKLTFESSLLKEQQLKKRISILNQRFEQLKLSQEVSLRINKEQVKQSESMLASAQLRAEKLIVRAGFDGVLQRLPVELGQSLNIGDEIALIGSVNELVAQVRVPQGSAQYVAVGQKAIVDTRIDKVEGIVERVEPIVEKNTVTIEISLPEKLPLGTRPQLNVDASIIIDTLIGVKYIRRPAHSKAGDRKELYHILKSGNEAKLKSIEFGREAGKFIEIVSGAQFGDEIIISDTNEYKDKSSQLILR
ncbi:HlyD family secretion protein [Pseudoalteromonas luteoviolacea]|uniref:HlyD family secretion protein n=1 Tax=Pseudoalteromonas luteoviolacea TaxID=43657 RepID=UPI0011505761|nr:HlyD family efflux transporter periplasmic adaptor subunit [Pseudoalteromonas luteoviolacea]TQF71326.1 HlyD family efflux transporter periplasmic adaptor subunit [Pseudoalteromonas luteoviolacea]